MSGKRDAGGAGAWRRRERRLRTMLRHEQQIDATAVTVSSLAMPQLAFLLARAVTATTEDAAGAEAAAGGGLDLPVVGRIHGSSAAQQFVAARAAWHGMLAGVDKKKEREKALG